MPLLVCLQWIFSRIRFTAHITQEGFVNSMDPLVCPQLISPVECHTAYITSIGIGFIKAVDIFVSFQVNRLCKSLAVCMITSNLTQVTVCMITSNAVSDSVTVSFLFAFHVMVFNDSVRSDQIQTNCLVFVTIRQPCEALTVTSTTETGEHCWHVDDGAGNIT